MRKESRAHRTRSVACDWSVMFVGEKTWWSRGTVRASVSFRASGCSFKVRVLRCIIIIIIIIIIIMIINRILIIIIIIIITFIRRTDPITKKK